MKFIIAFVLLFSAASFAQSHYYDIRPGDTVWTRSGYQGTVNAVFSNDTVSVRIGSSNINYSRQNLAVRGCFTRKGCSGDLTWTRSGYEGEINGVFPDDTVSVSIGSSHITYSSTNLAVEGCIRRLCTGTSVVTKSGYEGIVNGFFMDRNVSVRIGSSNLNYSIENLAYEDGGYGDDDYYDKYDYRRVVRVGETVWTASGYEGTVNSSFPDGSVSVRIGSSNLNYSRQNLAVKACYRSLCSRDRVVTKSGYNGVVVGIYYEGSIAVQIGSSILKYSYDNLGRL